MSIDLLRPAMVLVGIASLCACDGIFGIRTREYEPEGDASVSDAAPPDAAPTPPIDAGPPVPDQIPPTIDAITPKNGQTALHDDVKIVVTFSEPMRKDLAHAAFNTTSVSTVAPTFTWNDDGTVLTIDPHAAYTTGTDPAAVTATPYHFTIDTTITDLAGNKLAVPVSSQFTLYREITQSFNIAMPFGNNSAPDYARYTFPMAGDTYDNRETRGYMSFSIAALPVLIAEFERATIKSTIRGIYGSPGTSFGDMLMEHAQFSDVNADAYNSPALEQLGVFIPASPAPAIGATVQKDVTASVAADYHVRINRANLTQYRLRYVNSPSVNNVSDGSYVQNGSGSSWTTLDVTYLIE